MADFHSYVIVLDFPGIKEFVFGTDKLVEIRGASALLDDLNRRVLPKMAKEFFGEQACDCVFAGGGAGQLVINANKAGIDELFEKLKGHVHAASGGALRLIHGMAPLIDNDYATALQSAFFDLENGKRRNPILPMPIVHSGFLRDCDSCSRIAEGPVPHGGTTRFLCQSCHKKLKAGRDKKLWKDFAAHCRNQAAGPGADDAPVVSRPEDFNQIGELCQSRRGYTALVYGDGNAMGRLVKAIKTRDQFRLFSQAVDTSVREACLQALEKHCPAVHGVVPADILLLGGDDVMVYLAADCALPFAVTLARLFEELTLEKLKAGDHDGFFCKMLGEHGLTLSLGIAYGKSHTPLPLMLDQAEELLSSAKQKGSAVGGESYTPACIDFHNAARFNQVRVSDSRTAHLTQAAIRQNAAEGLIKLYCAPYTIDEAQALLNHAKRLKDSGIPRTRLHRLGEAPFMGKINATIETLTILGRIKKHEQALAVWHALNHFGCATESVPWRKDQEDQHSTVLFDLIQIADFVGNDPCEEADDESQAEA